MTLNIELLRTAVDWVEDQAARESQSEWWQQSWCRQSEECGTTYCVAGYIAIKVLGLQPVLEPTDDFDQSAREAWLCANGNERPIGQVARHALGITEGDAERLFYPANDSARVRQVASRIAADSGVTL